MPRGKCILCHHDASMPWGTENGYDAVRCAKCGLVYLDPWPDMTDRQVALEYGEHPGERILRTTARRRRGALRDYSRKLESIYGPQYFSGREIAWLDIGCGYGEFLETLTKKVAPQSVLRGSEPNIAKRASARKRGLDVKFYELEELSETYTHISLLNVFSHLPDPVAFLKLVRKRLRDDGEVLIQTGNGGDVNRSDFPGKLFFPDHLLFAAQRSLELMFDRVGMEVVDVKEFRYPKFTPLNVAKDIVKRVVLKNHQPVRWHGPFRDLWVRARPTA